MHRIFNLLFGWDYIWWENNASQGVSRIFRLPDGTVAYWRYRVTNCLVVITSPDQVTWLTCLPSKYGL